MNIPEGSLAQLSLGISQHSAGLTVVPLLDPGAGGLAGAYSLLPDALAAGTISITEVSEAGSVPELLADNRGDKPVLLVDGEELVGARQNRILNLSVMVPPHHRLRIPVSCVERGRWSYRGRGFSASEAALHARARSAKSKTVSESLRHGARDAGQMEIWQEIDRKSASMNVTSPTSALGDVFQSRRVALQEVTGGITAEPSQVGAVFAIGGRQFGCDLFDSPQTFAAYLPKLVRSWALDALEHGANPPAVDGINVELLLGTLRKLEGEPYPAVGLGTDLRFEHDGIGGGALVLDGRIVHLSAFST